MLRFGKQNDPGQVRMPTMSALPTADDLHFILSKAQRNWRVVAELSFRLSAGAPTFTVFVQCEMGTGDPTWTLKKETAGTAQVIWTHQSGDVALIHDLISTEFSADAAEAESAEGADDEPKEAGEGDAESAEAPIQEEEVDADKLAIESVFRTICRPETGILTYPAFLYFVDQEYRRFQRGGLPFSVVVFQMNYHEGEVRVCAQPLSLTAVHEAALRILRTKRDIDMLAHYGTFDFAFLLPHTESEGAQVFVERVQKVVLASPLLPGMDPAKVTMHFGIASMPTDCNRPALLVAGANNAMKSALTGANNVVLYKERSTYYSG